MKNLDVIGRIEVRAPNVTITNVCVTDDGGGAIGSPPAVQFDAGGGTISYSNVAGANATSESVEAALGTNGSEGQLHADHDYLHNCGECIHDNGWTLTNSYVITDGNPCSDGYSGSSCSGEPDHREAIYCNSGGFVGIHDTLLNPADQTAAVFCDTNLGGGGACTNQVTLENSLLAGGGYVIYTCGNASSRGTSQMTITGNDFARCGTRVRYQPGTGGRTCGPADEHATNGKGYWPRGGYFGIDGDTYCPSAGGGSWSDNYWDDNGSSVHC